MADYDLAIIGGGLTGASIARDAAGRGLSVVLFEQRDLGSGASSASSRLITGDLGGIERRALPTVRRALMERGRLLRLAPHLVRPTRFVVPLHPEGWPYWMLRLGLSLYDHLASRSMPRSAPLDLTHHEAGFSLQRPFGAAFEFSDALADDSRLVILNAVDAAARGASIRTGARCVRADRDTDWRIVVIDRGYRRTVTARGLVNATGAWVGQVAETVLRVPPPRLNLIRESQILVKRLFDHDRGYVLQQRNGGLVFATPYGADLTLVGIARAPFSGDPAAVAPTAAEVVELCTAVNRFFRSQITPSEVVRTICGVRAGPVIRRDMPRTGMIQLDRKFHEAPLVTTFGGDMTTYRWRAEKVVGLLSSFYVMSAPWTADVPLPGGDFDPAQLDEQVLALCANFPFLRDTSAHRLILSYGTRARAVLADARRPDDLGPHFGDELTASEVRYLMVNEWARTPDDILWRRSKLGLSMPASACDALARFMKTVA